jgi:1-acyl-sn-glycerol-3-phosphate acyltransferase
MIAARSLAFNALASMWTVLIFVLALPCLVHPAAVFAAGRLWSRGILALLAGVVGLRYRVAGLERRPHGALYAVKHQSTWETVALPLMLSDPVYVLKRELISVPLFGWYMKRTGAIPVDRAGGAKALRAMTAAARAAVAAKHPIIIFPEGTRTAPGERRPYHPGVAALYAQLGLPVVPVAHNAGLFWSRRGFLKRPGTITIEFLAPIEPGLPRRLFMERLENAIESRSAALHAGQ